MAILEEYLPQQVSGDALLALIDEVLDETGASTKREMGRVMRALTQKTGGNFDKAAAAAELRQTPELTLKNTALKEAGPAAHHELQGLIVCDGTSRQGASAKAALGESPSTRRRSNRSRHPRKTAPSTTCCGLGDVDGEVTVVLHVGALNGFDEQLADARLGLICVMLLSSGELDRVSSLSPKSLSTSKMSRTLTS